MMNLVMSGEIDKNFRDNIAALAKPQQVVRLRAEAYRLEAVDDSPSNRSCIRDICNASRIDHAFIEDRKRFSDFKLLAIDMDSTLITTECIDEIADLAGKKKEVAAITEMAMQGELTDFADSLRRRVALLRDLPVGLLERVYEERVKLTCGASELIATARKSGVYTILVSGGFRYFADKLRSLLSIDEAYANTLLVAEQRLEGSVSEPIFDAQSKRKCIVSAMQRIPCTQNQLLVIGDGANDIPMMQLTPYAIAYHGKSKTVQAANYSIKYTCLLTVLDYFQT